MDDSTVNWTGNGAVHEGDSRLADPRSIGDHARQIRKDATTLATEVRDTSADLEQYLNEQLKQHPYATLGVAAGLGYILGGGLRSKMTMVLLGLGTRLATTMVTQELAARIGSRDSAAVRNKNV
jgi:hypothetical protein